MADIKTIIDWVVNVNLTVFNHLRSGLGAYFFVWVGAFFAFPYFKKLLRALKGV